MLKNDNVVPSVRLEMAGNLSSQAGYEKGKFTLSVSVNNCGRLVLR